MNPFDSVKPAKSIFIILHDEVPDRDVLVRLDKIISWRPTAHGTVVRIRRFFGMVDLYTAEDFDAFTLRILKTGASTNEPGQPQPVLI